MWKVGRKSLLTHTLKEGQGLQVAGEGKGPAEGRMGLSFGRAGDGQAETKSSPLRGNHWRSLSGDTSNKPRQQASSRSNPLPSSIPKGGGK